MPQSKAKKKAYMKEYMAKKRGVSPPDSVSPESQNPVSPLLDSPAWRTVANYITRESPRMNNLERLQRLSGMPAPFNGMVWFGNQGLTLADIGAVIGTKEAKY